MNWLTFVGASVDPAFFSGDQAAHAQRQTWYIVRDMVKTHDDAAAWGLTSMLIMHESPRLATSPAGFQADSLAPRC